MKKLHFEVNEVNTGMKFVGGEDIEVKFFDVEGDRGVGEWLPFGGKGEMVIGKFVYHLAPKSARDSILEEGIKVGEGEEHVYAYTFLSPAYMSCVGDLFDMHGEGEWDVWVIETQEMSFKKDRRIGMDYKCEGGYSPSAVIHEGGINKGIVGWLEVSSDWFRF